MAPKLTVAVHSLYDASEKTLCALYLLDQIAVRRYHRIIWVVPDEVPKGSRYFGFSHKWDTEILPLSSKADQIKELLNQSVKINRGDYVPACAACIFLEESDHLYSLLPDTAKTVCWLDHQKWNREMSKTFVKKCNYVLSPSSHTLRAIAQPGIVADTLLCPFDSSLQLSPRVHISSGQTATLFYPAYGLTFTERQCIQQISEIVKECCPASKSAIGYYDTHESPEPGKDARTYDWKLLDYLKQTDWIVDLNPRPLMGLFGSFAGALGVQWSCFDLPPNNDEYSAARRHLIPCPKGGLLLKNAEKIAEHIVRQLTLPFNDDTERNRGAGAYAKRLKEFYRSLNRVFGVKSR